MAHNTNMPYGSSRESWGRLRIHEPLSRIRKLFPKPETFHHRDKNTLKRVADVEPSISPDRCRARKRFSGRRYKDEVLNTRLDSFMFSANRGH